MGDGRYYSYYQFYMVIWLTVLSVIAVYSIVNHYYKNKQHPKGKMLFIFYAFLLITTVLKFYNQLTPSLVMSKGLHVASLFFMYSMWIILLLLISQNKFMKYVLYILLSFTSLFLLIPDFYLNSYDFVYYAYNYNFLLLHMTYMLMTVIVLKHLWQEKELIHQLYNNRTITMMILFTFILANLVYDFLIFTESNMISYGEMIWLLILLLLVNFLSHYPGQNSMTSLNFSNFTDRLSEGIVITDQNGKIIMRNSVAKENPFTKESKININDLTSIFYKTIEKKVIEKAFTELYIDNHCYQVYTRTLKSSGYLITISDVTQIKEAISLLEFQKFEEERINKLLVNESKMSYALKKEELIEKYMTEINKSQGLRIQTLLKDMDLLLENKISHDEVIEKSKILLEDVRQAVTLYRSYYGG